MNNKNKCGSCYSKEAKTRLPQKYVANVYSCLKRRATNPTTPNYNKIVGLPIIERKEFVEWSLANEKFQAIYRAWQDSGFAKEMQPSIDRIDNTRGYEANNLQWLVLSENRTKDQKATRVVIKNVFSGVSHTFSSISEAGRFLNKDSGCIFYAIKVGKAVNDEWVCERATP